MPGCHLLDNNEVPIFREREKQTYRETERKKEREREREREREGGIDRQTDKER